MRKITDKFYQVLGLCRRAGKLVSGAWASEQLIRKRKAELVIVSSDASDSTKDKFLRLCKSRQIDIVFIGSKEELGSCIGHYARTIIAISDKRFKAMILDALPDTLKANMGVIDEWQK